MARSMKPIDCNQSLHLTKSDFQKTYMGKQCKTLAEGLATAIAATKLCAPVRTQEPYFPKRSPGRTPSDPEARWEQAIWLQWSDLTSPAVQFGWKHILHYQTMLRNENANIGWGEVDLIGMSTAHLPVVIELKVQTGNTPASMLVRPQPMP